LEELLSTKLRALYQRKKGRDLFDLRYAITKLECKTEKILESWEKYMKEENHTISRREFEISLEAKMESAQFICDMDVLIREGIGYDVPEAMEIARKKLIELILNNAISSLLKNIEFCVNRSLKY